MSIHQLAEELKIDINELLATCTKLDLKGKGSPLASLTAEEVVRLKAFIRGGKDRKRSVTSEQQSDLQADLDAIRKQLDERDWYAESMREEWLRACMAKLWKDRAEIWKKAANAGVAFGQYLWGLCCELGLVPEEGDEQAAKWYQMAADQGLADAQFSVGERFYEARNYKEAARWYRKAAAQGHAKAHYGFVNCCKNDHTVTHDPEEAQKSLREAARLGCWQAKVELDEGEFGRLERYR